MQSKNALNKGAQVTIFVVLGLVILFSIVTVVLIANSNTKTKSDYALKKYQGPINRGEIQSFVDGCVDLVARPAISRMASQGGYLSIPIDEFYVPQIPVTGTHPGLIQPIVPLTTAKTVYVPYAYFNGENHFPTIEHMQDELSSYVHDEVLRCLDNFSVFNYDLVFQQKQDMSVKTTISDNGGVDISVNYPIEFTSKDKTRSFTFDSFRDEVPYRLGRVRELARQVANFESQSNFLENATLEILAFSGLPYEGLDLNCRDESWKVSDLDQDFRPFLKYNFEYMKFQNTKFNESELYPNGDTNNSYYKARFLEDFTNDDFSDIRVDALYEDFWDINLDVNPKDPNGIVRPIDTGVEKDFMCVKTFHHRYDFNFPVLFRITDSYEGQNFVFNLVLPVSIRNNQPYKTDPYLPYGTSSPVSNSQLFCSDEGRDYGPVQIHAMDEETGSYISNVTINYICGNIFSCQNIGVIDFPKLGNLKIPGKQPVFTGKFPECNGATLELSAPGYETTDETVNTVLSDPQNSLPKINDVFMEPQKQLKYVVKIATDVNDPSISRDLLSDEMAIINVKKSSDLEYGTSYFYPINLSSYNTMPIIQSFNPVQYTFDVKLFKGIINSNNFDDISNGGRITGEFSLDNISFSYDDISKSDTLVIYVVSSSTDFPDTQSFYNYYQKNIINNMYKFKPVLQ